MSGSDSFVVDTNVLIFLLEGNRKAAKVLSGKTVIISFITKIELLGVPGIANDQKALLEDALRKMITIGFTETIGNKTIEIKQQKKIKVPDAIIAATSMDLDIPLLTADKIFSKIDDLACILFEV